MTTLSIVIVSYNTKKLLSDCMTTIIENTKNIKYEIIVVDNSSNDGSPGLVQKFAKKHPVKLIQNKKNVGFGKANNQGMKKAEGRYILLLNSDTQIRNNVLGEMASWMDEHPKVGISSSALKNPDGTFQGTGGYFPHLFRVFAWMFFLDDIPLLDRLIKPFHPMHSKSPFYKGTKFYEKSCRVDWVTGAFFLIRKEVINEVGYFDEDYFMYTEEVDYCWRIKKAGWKVWYLPQWSVIHLGGASSEAEFPILSEYKGIKLFYKKNKPGWQYPILRLFLKGGALVRIVIFGKTYAKAFKIA